MSGPKVVRIITREEIEAICRRSIEQVEEAIGELRRCAKRYNAINESLGANAEERLQELSRLLANERWIEVQKQAADAVAFLKSETDQIRARAVAAAEAARAKGRRIADAARTLLSRIEASGCEVPIALKGVAAKAASASDRELMEMQTVLNDAYKLLTKVPGNEGSQAQRDLAARLRQGETGQTFEEWLAKQKAPTDERDTRLDKLLAEIEALDEPHEVQRFQERAASIAGEPSVQRKALLVDSLILDLSEHCRQRRAKVNLEERLRDMRASLRALGTVETNEVYERVTSMLESSVFQGAEELLFRAQTLVDRETAQLAATARRRSVLDGLAQLGYEIREEMSTVWARDGRLIVRKPDATDYGIELGAPADVSRFQVQLVGSDRPSSPRDASRDRDMETTWCSEFDRLQELLANRGEVEIERRVPAGAQPVKTVGTLQLDPGPGSGRSIGGARRAAPRRTA